jgi:thioredoxin reductase (NADPH)
MFDWDVVIIGGGPAGLTAGLYLSRAQYRAMLLEKESFGGPMMNYELVENYPGFAEGVAGARLGSEMMSQASKFGLQCEMAEVVGLELFTSCRWVKCASGTSYTSAVVIVAGGARHKKLGVPGEEKLEGKGVFSCAFCDGGQYADKVVVVCGGGDAGVTEALYMTKLASRVVLVKRHQGLDATAILKERALANPKLEIRYGVKVEAIVGDSHVEAIEFTEMGSGQRGTLKTDGVLVHVGLEPNTDYLKGIVPLDGQGRIIVNDRMETGTPYIFAAGDIRSGSPGQIVTAVGDGATAAISAQRLLQELSGSA